MIPQDLAFDILRYTAIGSGILCVLSFIIYTLILDYHRSFKHSATKDNIFFLYQMTLCAVMLGIIIYIQELSELISTLSLYEWLGLGMLICVFSSILISSLFIYFDKTGKVKIHDKWGFNYASVSAILAIGLFAFTFYLNHLRAGLLY